MNNNLLSLVLSLAIVGCAPAEDLGGGDLPQRAIEAAVDTGNPEPCAQADMDTDLRDRTMGKDAPGSERDGDRIGDLQTDGEVAVGFGDFLACWWARDLEGGGSDFTGGCWDRNMGSAGEGTGGSDSKDRARSARA